MPAQDLNEKLFAQMMRMMPEPGTLEIPPKVFAAMQGEIFDYQEGQALTVRFPVLPHYQNPMGFMQGGMFVAAVDNTLGPLSYLVAPPSVTTQLNISYVRPVTLEDQHVLVEGRVLDGTRRQLFLVAEVRNEHGKLVTVCHTTCQIAAQ